MRQFLKDLAFSGSIVFLVGGLPDVCARYHGAPHPIPGSWMAAILVFWSLFGAVVVCPAARAHARGYRRDE